MRRTLTLISTLILSLGATSAWACPDANAAAGSILEVGDLSQASTTPVTPGNEVDLFACEDLPADLGAGGFISAAPSVRFTLSEDQGDGLILGSRSSCDTVMLMQGPDGSFSYSDDGGSARQPLISSAALAGDYRVWLGQYSQSEECAADIVVSTSVTSCPDLTGAASEVVALTADTLGTIGALATTAGGGVDISGCAAVSEDPEFPNRALVSRTANFDFTGSDLPEGDVSFSVPADCDTSLLAVDSTGAWHFNDDFGSSYNPRLTVDSALVDGLKMWVGTFNADVCEVEVQMGGGADIAGCPTATAPSENSVTVNTETNLSSLEFNLTAGGETDLYTCEGDVGNVTGSGYVSGQAQLSLTVEEGFEESIRVIGSAFCDTVLVINTPSGEWLYNDDSSGSDPAVSLPTGEAGTYRIWLGTYSSNNDCSGTLSFDSRTIACPNPELDANESYTHTAEELSEGVRHTVVAGGYTPLYECSLSSDFYGSGNVIDRPDFSFDLDLSTTGSVSFEGEGGCDTILLVQGPDGEWRYDDDGSLNGSGGLVNYSRAESGIYNVWVGTYGSELCEGAINVKRGLFKE